MATSVDHVMLNRLTGAKPSSIEEAVVCFRKQGVSRYLLTFDQDVFATALTRGRRHGLVRFRRAWSTLIRTTQGGKPLPRLALPEGIAIRRALDSDRQALGALMASAFDMPVHSSAIFSAAVNRPGWLALVAEAGQQIAGAGLVFLDERCAYLAGGATAPRFRRRGIQRVLVAARVRWAAEHGASIICSETGVAIPGEPNSSWANLVRAGLKPRDRREHLCPEGTTWAGA